MPLPNQVSLDVSSSCDIDGGIISASAVGGSSSQQQEVISIQIVGTESGLVFHSAQGWGSTSITQTGLPDDLYEVTSSSSNGTTKMEPVSIACAPASSISIIPTFTLPATFKIDITSNLNIVSDTYVETGTSNITWTETFRNSKNISRTAVINMGNTSSVTVKITVIDVNGYSRNLTIYWKKAVYVKQCGANQSGSYTATKTGFSDRSSTEALARATAAAVAEADANLQCDTDIKFKEIEMNDLSFSVSYSLEAQAWTCFHDYVPDAIFCTANKLMSFKDHYIYIHNQRNRKGSYYNKFAILPPIVNPNAVAPGGGGDVDALLPPPFKSQIEFVVANLLSKAYHAINWKSQYKTNSVIDEKKTFTAVMLYNHNQCSGEQPITLKRTTRNAEGVWRFNDFRDLVKSPNTIFLDKDGNVIPTNIMANKSFFKQSRFIGDYICVRMIFDNANSLSEIVLSDFSINDKVSYR